MSGDDAPKVLYSGSTEEGDGVPQPRSIEHVRQLSMSDCMDLLDAKEIDYGYLVELAELQDKIIEHLNIREDDNGGLQQRSWSHTVGINANDDCIRDTSHDIVNSSRCSEWR